MKAGWTLDDIDWAKFDPAKVDPETLAAVKAASMVEFNAADYVVYLRKVFDGDPAMIEDIERWGVEETLHGQALAKWAELADPSFSFEKAFARFRAGYKPDHFDSGEAARGGRAGEMIARCVVESGTSSFYSAIRDATDEPVLKQIAAHIAADEFRHYKLFYEGFLKYQPEENVTFLQRLGVAMSRVQEAEDDELAYAYYCGNVAEEDEARIPYDRNLYSRAYNARVLRFYRAEHIKKGVAMIAKPVGLKPTGRVSRGLASLLWWGMQARVKTQKELPAPAEKAA